jgi:GNAT superfamily N-acetyltransferase/uncharacterized damage-inducible protein DinB
VTEVHFEAVDAASPSAQAAMNAYFDELDRRFVDGFDRALAGTADDLAMLAPPRGVFLLGTVGHAVVACGGVQAVDATTVEIKRMWVDGSRRGAGVGTRLLQALEAQAAAMGFARVVLDTNGALTEAIAMYERSGYERIERYNDNPYAQHWFAKSLATAVPVTIDEVGRPEPPVAGGEVDAVVGFLDYQRATLQWKCSGIDEREMRATTAASAMTLGGLLKHMAWVEDYWFTRRLLGREPSAPWADVDWSLDSDWEWNSAAADGADELRALWAENVERSRRAVADVLADGGLDRMAVQPWPSGECPNLRWIMLHMIEEYARHNGHADLLREAVDGETGE